jgi:hypothetical protein
VKLIETGANLGFAAGNNVGSKVAAGKYLCLVNPDVIIPPDCLGKLASYLAQHADIGLLGPRMLGPNGEVRRSCLRFPTLWNSFLRALALDSFFKGTGLLGGYVMGDFHFDRIMDVEILNGWFWLARREAIEQVGLLDERFFMYGEDMDWCRRFHSAGWRVVFYPEAEAIHFGGASSAHAPVRFYLEQQRAGILYWKKYHGRISTFFYLFTLWLNQALRILGHGLVYLAKRSSRPTAGYKVRQSYACMRWLMGAKALAEPGTQEVKLPMGTAAKQI